MPSGVSATGTAKADAQSALANKDDSVFQIGPMCEALSSYFTTGFIFERDIALEHPLPRLERRLCISGHRDSATLLRTAPATVRS